MHIFINKLLITCCLIFGQAYAAVQAKYSCNDVESIVSNFVNTMQTTDWKKIRDNVYKLQSCKCEMAPVFYYIYRMRVVLPNSHALQGVSPNDFVLSQKLNMKEQINILRSCNEKTYLPLINSMIKQNFDAEISDTAIELKKQLASLDPM